jgi:hypothetical protein
MVDDKNISAKAIYAAEVLSVVQVTKRHLAELLRIEIDKIDPILAEIRSVGLPLRSSISEDNHIYYWMEKTDDS